MSLNVSSGQVKGPPSGGSRFRFTCKAFCFAVSGVQCPPGCEETGGQFVGTGASSRHTHRKFSLQHGEELFHCSPVTVVSMETVPRCITREVARTV